MTALWSFFVYEMRRNLPVLPVGLVAVGILALPAVRDVVADVGVEDHRLAIAASVLYLLVPALSVYLAFNAWLRERSEGTLRWLYARPLPTGALFAVRLAAMGTTLVLFTAVALAFIGVSPPALAVFSEPGLLEPGVLALFLLLLAVVPAVTVWASACALGRGWGGPLLLAGVAAAWLLPAAVPGLLPLPHELFEHREHLDRGIAVLRYGAFPLLLLAAAWWATRRAVADWRPRRQALLATATVAVGACLLLLVGASVAAWSDPERVTLVRELAEGRTLRYVEGGGLRHDVARVEVSGAARMPVFAGRPPWVAPDGRAAFFPGVTEDGRGWVLVRDDGGFRQLPDLGARPVGWSPRGGSFAFRCRASPRSGETTVGGICAPVEGATLLVVPRDGTPRPVLLPGLEAGPWRMQWLDESHLLVAQRDAAVRSRPEATQRWGVVSVTGQPARWVRPVRPLPPGQQLTTAYAEGRFFLDGYPVPRRDGRLLLWLGAGEERTLVALDPADWSLQPLAVRPWRSMKREKRHHSETLGTLDDGTAVWTERADGGHRVMVLPPAAGEAGAVVRRSCRLPGEPRPDRFLGHVGRRAVWSGGDRLLVCDLESGRMAAGYDFGSEAFTVLGIDVTQRGILVPRGDGHEVARGLLD